jgi:hypothetical protein
MKTLQSDFTTPEQSKRLLELGVPADSANCYYTNMRATIWVRNEIDRIDWGAKVGDVPFYTPCWSVGRLIEILSKCMPSGLYTPKFHIDDNIVDVVLDAIELELNYGLDFSKLED